MNCKESISIIKVPATVSVIWLQWTRFFNGDCISNTAGRGTSIDTSRDGLTHVEFTSNVQRGYNCYDLHSDLVNIRMMQIDVNK